MSEKVSTTGFSPSLILLILGIIDRVLPHFRQGSLAMQLDYPNMTVGVVIPAHNEETTIVDSISSVMKQSKDVRKIYIVDDASTDKTFEVLKTLAAKNGKLVIIHSDEHIGRAGGINKAVQQIKEDVFVTLDADTRMHPDYVREMLPLFIDTHMAVASGLVLPTFTNKVALTGEMVRQHRLIQYTYGQTLPKRGQRLLGGIIVSAGCCSMYKTEIVKKTPFPSRNMVEDMDYTWSLHEKGYHVGFCEDAIAYTVEPKNLDEYAAQNARWIGGFWNNLHDHSTEIFKSKGLAASIAFPFIEGIWLPIYYGIALVEGLSGNWLFFGVALALDVALVATATAWKGHKFGMMKKMFKSLPSNFFMRFYDAGYWIFSAVKYGLFNKRVNAWDMEDARPTISVWKKLTLFIGWAAFELGFTLWFQAITNTNVVASILKLL